MSFVGLIVTGCIEDSHLQEGNPRRLTNAIDYNGDICGLDSGVHGKDKAYFLLDGSGIGFTKISKEINHCCFI